MASKIKAPLQDVFRNGAAVKSAELSCQMNGMNANRPGEINEGRTVPELIVENTFSLFQPGRSYVPGRAGLAKRLRHHLENKPFDQHSRDWVGRAEFTVELCR